MNRYVYLKSDVGFKISNRIRKNYPYHPFVGIPIGPASLDWLVEAPVEDLLYLLAGMNSERPLPAPQVT